MRIGALTLLEQQRFIQSYRWDYRRALGTVPSVLDSLDEYEVDEIAIIRPVRADDTDDTFYQDLEVLADTCASPISFGGGLRSIERIQAVRALPVERLVFSSAAIQGNAALIGAARAMLGRQALQALLPLRRQTGQLQLYQPATQSFIPYASFDRQRLEDFNEVILFDMAAEGHRNEFDVTLLAESELEASRCILSGGIGIETIAAASRLGVAAVLLDNTTLHAEQTVRGLRGVGR